MAAHWSPPRQQTNTTPRRRRPWCWTTMRRPWPRRTIVTMQRWPQWTTNNNARKSWYYLCHDQPHLNLIFLSVSARRVLLAPANPRGFSTIMMACGCLPCLINVLYHFVQLLHYLPNIIPYFTVAIHCHVDTCVYSMLSLINFVVTGITNPRTILSTRKMVKMPP